ncbi:metalloprotease TIKI1-like [Gigantopelta aegis]|uniref:metalloprotease TIKI1-like n=1 Tax=Gigantopelta aegis TaxID=1735272 RepID=UPI001B88CAE7|nr:metalloprotease TIKI1-like [Gigantopelta aegis]
MRSVVFGALLYVLAVLHSSSVRSDVSSFKSNCSTEVPKNQSHLNSFLWTINRDPPSYLFGTIHVPYTRVWDFIPENTRQAFRQSENIFFELDLTDPQTISALSNCQLLPHGENLSNVLPTDIYLRLKRHLEYVRANIPDWMSADQKGRGIYADYLFNAIAGNWERKRPVWVMLMMNSLTERDIQSRGIPVLDLFLAQSAERVGKVTGAVEVVEEQCVPLNELNFSQVLFALNQTLFQHEIYRQTKGSLPYTTDDLIEHYNCGDLNSIIYNHDTAQVPSLVNSSLSPHDLLTARRIDDYFRDELINKRNERMAERAVHLLKTNPKKTFFFAFGAGHFLGNNSLIDRLVEAGFDVSHTAPDAEIPQLPISNTQNSRKPHRTFLSDMSADFPLPSDVIYGDIRYLYKKKIRHEKKRRKGHKKQLRAEQRRKQLDSLWNSLGPHSAYPWKLEKKGKGKRKRKKTNGRRKTFNDLWVRMEAERPSFLQQHSENSKRVKPTARPPVSKYSFDHSAGIHQRQSQMMNIVLFVLCILRLGI